MTNRILIIGDPIKQLSFATDSSLAIAEGALELGYQVHWVTDHEIELLNGQPVIKTPLILWKINKDTEPSFLHEKSESYLPLKNYEKIFIRKDPPFDESYVDLCWLLSQLPESQIINSPIALLTRHEKLTPFSLMQSGLLPDHACVPTLISKNQKTLKQFASDLFITAQNYLDSLKTPTKIDEFTFKIICKPWRGHAGRGVLTFSQPKDFHHWVDTQLDQQTRDDLKNYLIIQPLLPEIYTEGDRRVFVTNGKIAFNFVRKPAQGRIEANLAQGGSAELSPMPLDVQELAEKIATVLKKWGILIAGLDFIGNKLTEINVTSPTGIRTFEELTGTRIAKTIMKDLLGV